MKKLGSTDVTSIYQHITEHASELVGAFMIDAFRRVGTDSTVERERAYGLYLGWRSMAVELTDAATFRRDDELIEALIVDPPITVADLALRRLY